VVREPADDLIAAHRPPRGRLFDLQAQESASGISVRNAGRAVTRHAAENSGSLNFDPRTNIVETI